MSSKSIQNLAETIDVLDLKINTLSILSLKFRIVNLFLRPEKCLTKVENI